MPTTSARHIACFALAASSSVFFLNCSSSEIETSVTGPVLQSETQVADQAARTLDSDYFVDLEFAKGSDRLEDQWKSALSSLLKRARAESSIQNVQVLVWADEEYPSAQIKKLSRGQRKLADARAKALVAYIKSLEPKLLVQSHNMAARPGTLSRWFNTPDARFKRSLVAAGLPTTAEDAPVIGRASHAVIFVR